MKPEVLDDLEKISSLDSDFKAALSWWEKRRIVFNVFVGIAGLIPVILNTTHIHFADIIGLLLYGLIMNIFYSTGFVMEALNLHYFNRNSRLASLRYPLLIIGTLFSSFATLIVALMSFGW